MSENEEIIKAVMEIKNIDNKINQKKDNNTNKINLPNPLSKGIIKSKSLIKKK